MYRRLFDGIFEAFHLLGRQFSVAVLIELFNNKLCSFSAVLKFAHQQFLRLFPTHLLVVSITAMRPNTTVKPHMLLVYQTYEYDFISQCYDSS